MSSQDIDELKLLVTQLYREEKEKSRFTFAIYSMGQLTYFGPFKTAIALDRAWKEAFQKSGDPAALNDPLQFYSTLASSKLFNSDSGWTKYQFAARWPEIPKPLQSYAAVWLARKFAEQRVRPYFWSPEQARPPSFLENLSKQFLYAAEDPQSELIEVSWEPPPLKNGFRVELLNVVSPEGQELMQLHELSQKKDFPIPDLTVYGQFRQKLSQAISLSELSSTLAINPMDSEGVNLAADLSLAARDLDASIQWLSSALELKPDAGERWRQYANALYDRGPQIEAQSALETSRKYYPADPLLAERLGRIHLQKKDRALALQLFDTSLNLDPRNETLWWICADLARDSNDTTREIRSLENALALNDSRLDRRTRLISLLLARQDLVRARGYVAAATPGLPPAVPVLSDFARFHEKLGDPDKALELWTRTVSVQPDFEQGHFESVRLLTAAKKLSEGLAAAEAGLEKVPASARLHLARADLLQQLNRLYDSRRHLQLAATRVMDIEVLRHHAAMEDIYGKSAAEAYQKLLQSLERSGAPLAQTSTVQQRGMLVSLRDNDRERASWFAARQQKSEVGTRAGNSILTMRASATPIPGGLAGLAFTARMKKTTNKSTFLNDFSRTVLDQIYSANPKSIELFRDELLNYFAKVRQLDAFGRKSGDLLTINLSVKDRNAIKATERVMDFFGYKLKSNNNKISLDAGEKKQQGRKQDLLNALGLDPIAMVDALEAGKDFAIEIEIGSANVILGEAIWLKEFAPKGLPAGGFPELLVLEPSMAKIYTGLSAAEQGAAEQLVKQIGLHSLASDKYADLLYLYGSCFGINARGHAVVPGGESARPAWRSLVQADSTVPAEFYKQLFLKDGGKPLAFFSNITQLDPLHQAYFTRSPERLAEYYSLFRDSPEMKLGAAKRSRDSSFIDFLREIPLNSEGTVAWPGSAEVWTVAKGNSSLEKTQRLMIKVNKAVAPEAEDSILVRLARLRYSASGYHTSQLDNFLAVARIDALRKTPLTETEALLLSQSLGECAGAIPYIAVFTELKEQDLTRFIRFAARVKDLNDVEANHLLAHFHGLSQLLNLLQLQGVLTAAQTSPLFSDLCEKLTNSATAAGYAEASASILEAVLKVAKVPSEDASGWWLEALGGPAELGRRDDMQKILQSQKAPDIGLLLELVRAAREIPVNAAGSLATLESKHSKIATVQFAKGNKITGEIREMIELYNAPNAAKLVLELRKEVSRKKSNPKDLEKLSRELLKELAAPLALAAISLDYAYFLRTSDLSAMEDPFLIRKHEFIELNSDSKKFTYFADADFNVHEQTSGGYGRGTLAGLAHTVGIISRAGGQVSGSAENVISMQTAALRSTPMWRLTVDDFRRFKLSVLAAKEWVVQASRDDKLLQDLDAAAVGIISTNRRSRLLAMLSAGEVADVWEVLNLSELYWIGNQLPLRYRDTEPWSSPLWAAMRNVSNKPNHLHLLGPVFLLNHGSPHPTFEPKPPYEDYERFLLPQRIAERVAEFKLFLVWLADHQGLEPIQLALEAEPLLNRAVGGLKMTGLFDWQSALDAWAALHPSWLKVTQ